MTIYYLYVKTHNITGLKYLGFTGRKDPHKYPGSGTRWLNHLHKHGFNYCTDIIKECTTKDEIKTHGIYYSQLWNIVKDKSWANLKEERGDGGGCSGEANGMFGKKRPSGAMDKAIAASVANSKGRTYEEIYGIEKANILKKKRAMVMLGRDHTYKNNPRFDPLHYKFMNIKSGELLYCSRWVFIKYYNINKTGVSDMINRGIIYKDWCVLYS
jgi:hypothetical protein